MPFCHSYQPYLPKGTLIKVYTKIPLSTGNLEEGSKVYFIVPNDVWVLEKKAVERGDIFKGEVSFLKMPAKGVNAAMQITITEIIKKEGYVEPLRGKIIFPSGDTLGGTLTNPASYNKTFHPRKVYGNIWGAAAQYVPSGDWEFGQHVEVTSKDNLFVELKDNYYIY